MLPTVFDCCLTQSKAINHCELNKTLAVRPERARGSSGSPACSATDFYVQFHYYALFSNGTRVVSLFFSRNRATSVLYVPVRLDTSQLDLRIYSKSVHTLCRAFTPRLSCFWSLHCCRKTAPGGCFVIVPWSKSGVT